MADRQGEFDGFEASDGDDSPFVVELRPGTRTPDHPLHDGPGLLDNDFHADPFALFEWMREHAPVYWDDDTGIWGIVDHADVSAIEANHGDFCSRMGSRPTSSVPSMINMDPPDHTTRRRIVSSGFTPRRVADHEAFLRSTVTELIDAVVDSGECDFVADIATPIPLRMIANLMGLPDEDHEKLVHWSDLFATGGDDIRDEVVTAVQEYADYMVAILQQRTDPDAEDLISLLVHAEDEARLEVMDLIFETMLILVGGDETTRHVMSGGLEALLRNPEQLRALQADRSLLPGAIEEMLRWVSPVRNMTRTATRDLEFRGQQIRNGDKFLLLYLAANRDPAEFDDPYRFDITRTPNRHVAFGGNGRHFCLGAQLARLELTVLFEEVLDRLPNIALADPDTTVPERRGNFVLGLERLPVLF